MNNEKELTAQMQFVKLAWLEVSKKQLLEAYKFSRASSQGIHQSGIGQLYFYVTEILENKDKSLIPSWLIRICELSEKAGSEKLMIYSL